MSTLVTQPMIDAVMPEVRKDLGPVTRLRVAHLVILHNHLVAKHLTHVPNYPSTTLEAIEDEIAMYNGHRHQWDGGAQCIHCGWEYQAVTR